MQPLNVLRQLSKRELVQRCVHLQKELKVQETVPVSWIDRLTAVALTNQDMTISLTKGLHLVLKAVGMNRGYIHTLDQKERLLRLRACLGLSKRAEQDLRTLREGEKIPGRVLQKSKPLSTRQYAEMTGLSDKTTQAKKRMLHAGFPLQWNGRVLGTLTVVSRNHERLSERDRAILRAFSQFMAVVVQNFNLFDTVSQGKRQWENAIDFVSDLVVICDGDFRIVRTNRAILDRLWLPIEDAIGKECFQLLYDGNALEVPRQKLETVLRRGFTYYEEAASSRWGGIFSVFVSPIMAFGRLTGSVHVIGEITHERLLEKDREDLARKVSLFAPGTITVEPEGRILTWDSGARDILGYEEAEIKGKPLALIFSSPETDTSLEELRENGGVLDFDTVAIAKGERSIPVSLTFSACRNQGEGPDEVTVFVWDMSERQESTGQVCRFTQLNAMIDMAASVSDKLGKRLETVTAQIRRLENGTADPQQITKRLERVAAHARSVEKTLQQLHRFSDIRAEEKPEMLESAQLIQGLVEMVKGKWNRSFRARDIVFEVDSNHRNLPLTLGNLHQLLEVFDHLIRNAVEAMPAGGKLVLQTRADRKWLNLILIDHGIGMNSEEINRAFEPFFTSHPQNLGLGLSIVHRIIRKYHGQARLQSVLGQGTRVTVRLPTTLDQTDDGFPASRSSVC